ncbi:hypothetical protein [Methanobrevibacter sp. DSM 116169]|uniref:hypothetical protein n=1 Tax=Methanobrevibacter sp. DSM 116169 TaxID=3242727 RepID=UPI0038FD1CF1
MFVTIFDPVPFVSMFQSIKGLTDTVGLVFSDTGLRVCVLDRSHIVFIELYFKHEFFSDYETTDFEEFIVDCDDFLHCFSNIKSDNVITLSSETDELLNVIVESDYRKVYDLGCVERDYKPPAPPQIDVPTSIILPQYYLKDCLKEVEYFKEALIIKVNKDNVEVKPSDDLMGGVTLNYIHECDVKEEVSSMYSCEKLKEILRADKISNEWVVSLGLDTPLLLENISDSGDYGLKSMIAPRIENRDY